MYFFFFASGEVSGIISIKDLNEKGIHSIVKVQFTGLFYCISYFGTDLVNTYSYTHTCPIELKGID